MPTRERLARSLRRLRRERGWTQGEAARRSGIDLRHYQRIEGAHVAVTLDTLDLLAAAFVVSTMSLLAE
jgi:transcriptional regulator with XRE-family HTH domain